MAIETTTVRDAIVYRSADYTHRWFDAFGTNVSKYLQEFITWPVDDTTHDPTEWVCNITEAGGGGDSTAIITDVAGGALLVTTDNQENDGWQMQLGHGPAGAGENVDLSARYPLYCGIEFCINDVDQTDVLFGVCITDTDCLGAVTDGIYFRSVDETDDLYFVLEKDSVESATLVTDLVDSSYVVLEFLYDTDGTVYAYVNGTEVTSTANSSASFPNDELMRLTFEFLTGEATANTCTVRWMRMIHIR